MTVPGTMEVRHGRLFDRPADAGNEVMPRNAPAGSGRKI